MGNLRFDVVQEAFRKKAAKVEKPAGKPSDYFGSLVFGRSNMRRYLDSQTYARLTRCIDDGVPLDSATADKVAEKAAAVIRLLRQSIDKLEEITDNALWPLPKYREILFIN